MWLKSSLAIALLSLSQLAVADTEFLAAYTDVESIVEAKKRLGTDDIREADLLRTHYVVERDLKTLKVIIRPLEHSHANQTGS